MGKTIKVAKPCCGSCIYCVYLLDYLKCDQGTKHIDVDTIGCADYRPRNPQEIKIYE